MTRKVCHLTNVHNSKDTRIFYKECTSLAAAGYETYLVAQGECRKENGVRVIGIGNVPAGRLQRMTSFAKAVYEKALGLDCDIYHLHDPELLPYGLKLKKHGKKVIFDSHENTLEQMLEKEWIPYIARPLVSFIYKQYAVWALRQYDYLIAVTPHIVNQLKSINPNTIMITNYPKLIEYWPNSNKKNTMKLCFTGGVDRQWSHDLIVDSLKYVESVEYELCGPISKGFYNQLKNNAGWEKVNFHGTVSLADSLRIQQNSDVGMALLRPSRNTDNMKGTLGNTKLFEYMMARIPIICTSFDLWNVIVDRWNCGICVPPDDEKKLLEAINFFKNHPNEAQQMGENGRKAVEQEFNWRTQEKKLLELYSELAD